MNHASWLDAWDRGLIVPASAAMQWKGRSLNRPPYFFFFFKKKQYKEIRLSDETKQPPTVPTRPCNLSKARSAKLDFEKEGACCY